MKLLRFSEKSRAGTAEAPQNNSSTDSSETDPDRYLLEKWLRLAAAALNEEIDKDKQLSSYRKPS